MAKTGIYQQIDTLPGVQPPTDKTQVNTRHYTNADKVRFKNGVPEKIGGWIPLSIDYDIPVVGCVRTIYTEVINGQLYTLVGTHEKLYVLQGSTLTNITPLVTTPTAVPNSLSTQYGTLVNDPFSTVDGSPVVTVLDPEADRFVSGDLVAFSGSVGFAGIPSGNFNSQQVVRTIGSGFYTINVGVNANATTSGGGAAVNRASGLINVSDTAHGQLDGDRVKISGAADTGGILAADINREFIIRNASINDFDVMTDGTATSAVTASGGAGTQYFEEIPIGALNQGASVGYGAGLYGVGLYGTALVSTTDVSYPRIWYCDRYGNTIVLTPGNQGGVYQWMGDANVAPAIVPNAPTAVNYLFVSDNILVTFGAANGGNEVDNRIFASDQNDITQWTSSSVNQVYDDDIEGAGRLLSHVPVEDYSLIFTENKVFTFRYIGLPFVWEVKELDPVLGLIGSMAKVNCKGVAVWQGLENFYMYRGGVVEVVPANSQEESTCLDYVFDNMNWSQKSKNFAWYNKEFQEVWFHYPSAASNEPDRVVVVDALNYTWTIHTLDRTAAEYPGVKSKNPRLGNYNSVVNTSSLFQHEVGTDAVDQPLPWTIRSNKRYYGRDNNNLNAIIPDSIQFGNISLQVLGYEYPQSAAPTLTGNYTITPTTERVQIQGTGRYHQYTMSGAQLGQSWTMGEWLEEVQKGPTQ